MRHWHGLLLIPAYSIKSSLPVFLFVHVPNRQWYSEAQILKTVLHKGSNLLREFICPMQTILSENQNMQGVYFVYLYPLFELMCQFQPNMTVWNCPKYCICCIHTSLHPGEYEHNMQTLEKHLSEFCCSQSCQKVFVTHLWLHYAEVRYFILT